MKRKIIVTVKHEYIADSRHYDTEDINRMIEIDKTNAENDPYATMSLMAEDCTFIFEDGGPV